MALSIADQVWNRAAIENGGTKPWPGDEALASLLYAHGMIMNGGLGHMFGILSASEVAAAARGFRFYGLDAVADLLAELATMSEEVQEASGDRYATMVPTDATLAQAFERVYEAQPGAFAPLGK